MTYPRIQPGGALTLILNDDDGSTSESDITEYANLLLELGASKPRSEADLKAATVSLGELSCSTETVFVVDNEPMDAGECLGIIADGLYRLLGDVIGNYLDHEEDSDGASELGVLEVDPTDNSGRTYVSFPDSFWEMGCVANNERFDLLVLEDGALLLRPCPYSQAEFAALAGADFHAEDPRFTLGSHCGLTKWTCAGCGVPTIVEDESYFPEGWFEVSRNKPNGDTLAFEAVCSMECLAKLSAKGPEGLRRTRNPGFDPPKSGE